MPFHNFRGQRTGQVQKSRGFSQASTRHHQGGFDQYGRPWSYSIENESGAPCSIPMPSFSAPFLPDPEHVHVNPDDPSQVYVDNIAIARTRRNALRGYHQDAIQLCSDNKWPTPKVGDYSGDVIGKLNRPPRAFQPFIACEQENPWALGWDVKRNKPFKGEADPRLVQFIELPSHDLSSELDVLDFSAGSYERAVAGDTRSLADINDVALDERSDEEAAFAAEAGDAFGDLNAIGGDDDDASERVELDGDLDEEDQSFSGDASDEEPLVDQVIDQVDRYGEEEEAHDPDALGGKKVNPRRATVTKPTAGKAGKKPTAHESMEAFRKKYKGKTLAAGNKPAISDRTS